MLNFFFNDTATTEIYTLSLHDALPICDLAAYSGLAVEYWELPEDEAELVYELQRALGPGRVPGHRYLARIDRSEEHTSELQSRQYLVCRLLLEKKKKSKSLRSIRLCSE